MQLSRKSGDRNIYKKIFYLSEEMKKIFAYHKRWRPRYKYIECVLPISTIGRDQNNKKNITANQDFVHENHKAILLQLQTDIVSYCGETFPGLEKSWLHVYIFLHACTFRVSQLGSTAGGYFGQNGQKLH